MKINISFSKKRVIIFFILAQLITLPLIIVSLKQQQETRSQASTIKDESILSVSAETLEDNPPADTVPTVDPKIAQSQYDSGINSIVNETTSTVTTSNKPNIVVLMLDDVNPIDGRFWQQSIMPYTWNYIVSKGINFTNFYGETSLCCPGRVGFLTGQHSQNHNVVDLDGTKFNPAESIATELQVMGYYTMLDGKYINNYTAIPLDKAIPPGWTKFDAIYSDNGKYYNYNWVSKVSGTKGSKVWKGTDVNDYSTDVIARTALRRFKEAPADQPIFALITPFAIHGPRTVAERHKGNPRCANIAAWKTPSVYEVDVSDKPAYIQGIPNKNPTLGFGLRTDCEVLLAVDDLVKHIVNELGREGRLNNTVFILTADNGYAFGEHRVPAKTTPYTTPIPFYVAWPAGRGNLSAKNLTTLTNIDLAETLCQLAGCTMGPYPNGQTKSDGVSFLSLIKNQPASFVRYSILESQPIVPSGTAPSTRPAWWAVRTTEQNPQGKWHYVEYKTGEKELYDLSNGPCYLWSPSKGGDPCELNNLLRSGATLSTTTKTIASYLASELSRLKTEKGFKQPASTKTSISTPTITPAQL